MENHIAYDPKAKGSEAYLNLAKEVIASKWKQINESGKRRALGRGLEELFFNEQCLPMIKLKKKFLQKHQAKK